MIHKRSAEHMTATTTHTTAAGRNAAWLHGAWHEGTHLGRGPDQCVHQPGRRADVAVELLLVVVVLLLLVVVVVVVVVVVLLLAHSDPLACPQVVRSRNRSREPQQQRGRGGRQRQQHHTRQHRRLHGRSVGERV